MLDKSICPNYTPCGWCIKFDMPCTEHQKSKNAKGKDESNK